MSIWTSIHGTIEVNPVGRTQAEKRYVLDTVLEHLPVITGSENDMKVYVLQPDGFDRSSNVDEFGKKTNNLICHYGNKDRTHGTRRIQGRYILVVDADLRDREFYNTFCLFQKWICRLAKRVYIERVLVEMQSLSKEVFVRNTDDCYSKMFEFEDGWYEYLLWDKKMDDVERG